jgi:phospholipid/cholesterol/gamma-HCH transport system ATP-binding protein
MQEFSGQFAIRVEDLLVGFNAHVVIDHLSLDVRRGEILGLVGASGGGKSVLMRTIIGLIPRQGGEIEVMGAAIGGTRDRSTQNAAGRSVSAGRAVFVAHRAAEYPVSFT